MTQTTRKKRTELRIDTPEDLVLFAHAINKLHNEQQRDLLVTLTNDIDLTDVAWVPIGNEDIPFYGTFDGGGHSISGLHIDKREGICCGLFGVCAGTVEHLTVTGSITCVAADVHSAAGGIVGNVQGHSTVSDCLNRGVMDANEYDFEFLTLGDIVGRWEGESVVLVSGRRETLSGHHRAASSMTQEER